MEKTSSHRLNRRASEFRPINDRVDLSVTPSGSASPMSPSHLPPTKARLRRLNSRSQHRDCFVHKTARVSETAHEGQDTREQPRIASKALGNPMSTTRFRHKKSTSRLRAGRVAHHPSLSASETSLVFICHVKTPCWLKEKVSCQGRRRSRDRDRSFRVFGSGLSPADETAARET